MTEADKRLRRCCFSGHRPEKLKAGPETVKAWLEARIDEAIADGYVTFITGMGMGADIWAGEILVRKKEKNPQLHLIAAAPYPTFSYRWNETWKKAYQDLWKKADLRIEVCKAFDNDAFEKRNIWMVNHANRLIAYYNGDEGSTRRIIDYARQQGIGCVVYAEKEMEERGNAYASENG